MPPPRIMALDVGKVRIGIALTDPLGYTAQPLLTLHRKHRNEDLRAILRLTRKHEIAQILIGNPLHLSGDPSPWTLQVHEFAAALQSRTPLPITLVDERLTTRAAHEILTEAGHDPRNRKHLIDQVAAVVILNSWLQTQTHLEKTQATSGSTSEP